MWVLGALIGGERRRVCAVVDVLLDLGVYDLGWVSLGMGEDDFDDGKVRRTVGGVEGGETMVYGTTPRYFGCALGGVEL